MKSGGPERLEARGIQIGRLPDRHILPAGVARPVRGNGSPNGHSGDVEANGSNGGSRRNKLTKAERSAWAHQSTEVAALMTKPFDEVEGHLFAATLGSSHAVTPQPATGESRSMPDAPLPGNPPPPIEKDVYSPTMIKGNQTTKDIGFYELREDKFFATKPDVRNDAHKTVGEILRLPPDEPGLVLSTIEDLRNLLGVKSLREVAALSQDERLQKEGSRRAYELLGNMYDIPGTPEIVEKTIKNYGETANNVIDALRKAELSQYESGLEMSNDVYDCNDPIGLLLITFDNSYADQPRFEAKRKLEIMRLVANIDLRDREMKFSDRQTEFNEFLTERVYSQEERKGQLEAVYFLTTFNPETYETDSVRLLPASAAKLDTPYVDPETGEVKKLEPNMYIDPETNEARKLEPNQKLTRMPRRSFTYKGRKIPINVGNAQKAMERKVLKLIRKGVENPAEAVDDDVRMMGVFNTYQDILDFRAHFKNRVIAGGSFIRYEQLEDTINGGERKETRNNAVSNGGDKTMRWVKFHARFRSPEGRTMYVEFMLHTKETLEDYRYKRGRSHDEFTASQFFGKDDELGVGDLFFPHKFYDIDMKVAREDRIAEVRNEIERPSHQS